MNIPESKNAGVYCITNLNNQMKYVGSTRCIRQRIQQHFKLLSSGKHPARLMQEDFNNGDPFCVTVLKEFSNTLNGHRSMLTYEHDQVFKLNSIEHGYNRKAPSADHPPITPQKSYRFNIQKLAVYLSALEGYETVHSRSSIRKICKELNCQPGDIMEYVPDEKEE